MFKPEKAYIQIGCQKLSKQQIIIIRDALIFARQNIDAIRSFINHSFVYDEDDLEGVLDLIDEDAWSNRND